MLFLNHDWFSSGIFLFLLELIIVCWVKFYFITQPAAVASTVILVPVIILFWIFALHFYRRLTTFKLNHHQDELNQLESRFIVARLSLVDIVWSKHPRRSSSCQIYPNLFFLNADNLSKWTWYNLWRYFYLFVDYRLLLFSLRSLECDNDDRRKRRSYQRER